MESDDVPLNVAIILDNNSPGHGVPQDVVAYQEELATAQNIAASLERRGHHSVLVPLEYSLSEFISRLESSQPDVVFNLCSCAWGEGRFEAHVAALLELMGMPFTGCGSLPLALCLNKVEAKRTLQRSGIPTPEFAVVHSEAEIPQRIKFPSIVKPAAEDASIGIDNDSVVDSVDVLKNRLEFLASYYPPPYLVERFIAGRELNVALWGGEQEDVLPISEICFEDMPAGLWSIVSYAAKWHKDTPEYQFTVEICPAKLNKITRKRVEGVAQAAYNTLRCDGYARVDIRLDKDGIPWVLEVNPNPSIAEDGGFFRSAKAAGLDYDAMIERMVLNALVRGSIRDAHSTTTSD